MDFGCYYDPNARGPDFGAGLLRGGFWKVEDAPPGSEFFPRGNYCGKGPDVVYTGYHYGAFNTEPRIASYIGIAMGQVPPEHYFAGWRTFPPTCDWGWQEMAPQGETRTYLGIEVYEGHYTYRGMNIVPSWGGFFDAVNVSNGDVSTNYLALDQGMIMASIANALRNDRLQHYFVHGTVEEAMKLLMEMEEFTAGP